jgi:hypothetical protein
VFALLWLVAAAAPQLPSRPQDCPTLAARLRAAHQVPVAEFRRLLDLINAEYPNDMGVFAPKPIPRSPGSKHGAPPPPAPKESDWLPDLLALTPPPELAAARSEAIDIVGNVHALAQTGRWDQECPAARVLLDFAFEDLSGVFRDEVGRQVRTMGAAALPPLIRLAMGSSKIAKGERRYANYQLDRMDRQRPETAMAQVHDDRIRAEILTAYGETRPNSAVNVVLGECGASSPRVRRAARWAWMQYLLHKPPDPPRRRLNLGGGKVSHEARELYLSYRELCDLEIRRQWPALMGEPADPEKTLEELSEELFARQDAERTKRWDALFDQAEAKRKRGDLEGAVGVYEWILAQDPFYGRRAEMAPGLYALGRARLAERKYAQAAGWLRQASILSPFEAKSVVDAELALSEGLAEVARGGDDSAPLERALALDPGSSPARLALMQFQERRVRNRFRRHAPLVAGLILLGGACTLLFFRIKPV